MCNSVVSSRWRCLFGVARIVLLDGCVVSPVCLLFVGVVCLLVCLLLVLSVVGVGCCCLLVLFVVGVGCCPGSPGVARDGLVGEMQPW